MRHRDHAESLGHRKVKRNRCRCPNRRHSFRIDYRPCRKMMQTDCLNRKIVQMWHVDRHEIDT